MNSSNEFRAFVSLFYLMNLRDVRRKNTYQQLISLIVGILVIFRAFLRFEIQKPLNFSARTEFCLWYILAREATKKNAFVRPCEWRYALFRLFSQYVIDSYQFCFGRYTNSNETSFLPRRKTKATQYILLYRQKRTTCKLKSTYIVTIDTCS